MCFHHTESSFDPEWKNKLVPRLHENDYKTKSYLNEAKLSREPAAGQQKSREKQDYACAIWDVTRSRSGMNFDLRLHDSGIESRTGKWNESFDPEWEPGANSIRNNLIFVPDSCNHCALKCRVTRGVMKKPEWVHSGSKLDSVSGQHILRPSHSKHRTFYVKKLMLMSKLDCLVLPHDHLH